MREEGQYNKVTAVSRNSGGAQETLQKMCEHNVHLTHMSEKKSCLPCELYQQNEYTVLKKYSRDLINRTIRWLNHTAMYDHGRILHLKSFKHLINQILDLFFWQPLQLHQLPQICPHEWHHEIASWKNQKRQQQQNKNIMSRILNKSPNKS